MDLLKIYEDFHIQALTEGHKHCRPGWVNIPCPFCTGNPGYHLGAPLNGSHFRCWRCGWHPTDKVLAKVLNMKPAEISALVRLYGGVSHGVNVMTTQVKIRRKAHKFPTGVVPLTKVHKKYLESRNFDPDKLEKDWDLVGTEFLSLLDKIDYSRRIIAPIYWNDIQVSFQARDITGKDPLKYKACPQDREIIDHKQTLYGDQRAWGKTGVCVEGIFDVWRFGKKSFGTYGIEFTPKQVRLIAKTFKNVVVIYDGESQAIAQANKLVEELKFRRVNAWRYDLPGPEDPAQLSQEDANYLIKSLL